MGKIFSLFSLVLILTGLDSAQAMKLHPEFSRDELKFYVQAKREKYKSLASAQDLPEESLKAFKSIDDHLNISLLRFSKATMREELLKRALTADFENVSSIIKRDLALDPLRSEWKSNIRDTLERSHDAQGHDTLIVGCGHINTPAFDGSEHLHEGHYTINNHACEDESSPDFEADITKSYLIQKKFPKGHQFQAIYLEYITEEPLQADTTFRNALHLLKPGGKIVFDNYFSCVYVSGPNSEIDRFSAKVGFSQLEVKFDVTSTDLDSYRSEFSEIGVNLITDETRHYISMNDKLETCAAILMKKHLEQLGFINVSFGQVEANPYNHRKNSSWFTAYKPE